MISPGAICTIRQHGAQLWVVKCPGPEAGRWYLTRKSTNRRGQATYQNHLAGVGDLTLVLDAKTYQPGDTVNYRGLDHIVLEDRGDDVELGVPEHTAPTKGIELVRIPAGNVTTISKTDLTLEDIK
jgi:hypothetical protein